MAVHLVCGLAAGLACGEYFSVARWDPALGADAYAQFLGALMPLMSAIVCGLAVDEERAAGRLANLTAAPSRGHAVAAKLLALAALGAGALAVALGVFGAVLAAAGRLPLGRVPPLAAAWAGIVLGGPCRLHALGLGVALRLGRNATIGAGAAGTLVAFFSVGGLAHGLMTGELTGALPNLLFWVPLALARPPGLARRRGVHRRRPGDGSAPRDRAGLPALLSAAAAVALAIWFRRFEGERSEMRSGRAIAAVSLCLLAAALVLGGNALLDAGWGPALRSVADRMLPNPEVTMWAPVPEPGSHAELLRRRHRRQGRTTSTWWTRRTPRATSASSSSSSSDGSRTARAGSRSRARRAAQACATARATRPRRPRPRAGRWAARARHRAATSFLQPVIISLELGIRLIAKGDHGRQRVAHILAIDDERAILDALARVLGRDGGEVAMAARPDGGPGDGPLRASTSCSATS